MGPMGEGSVSPAHVEELLKQVGELTQRVAELEARPVTNGEASRSLGFSDDRLAALATSIYRTRQNRLKYFDPALFAEPGWDMLLDLFINKIRGARVSTGSLCLAAGTPQATGIRWINLLQQHGMLRRYTAPDDARLVLIEMTPKAFRLMRDCLSEGAARLKMSVPD